MSAPDIQEFALIAMTATIRNLSEMKNVPVADDRVAEVAQSAVRTLTMTDIYGLGKGHRESVVAAAAVVNRCLYIIAATRRAIAKVERKQASSDVDAIVARVQQSPDLYIPADARTDIYRWPDIPERGSEA
jgi:alkylhydroperoxidase family enzyme